MSAPLQVSQLTITYRSRVRRTEATHAIQQAFDISPADIRTTAVQDLSFALDPGDILLIDGPSGSGKTTLLEAILGRIESSKAHIDGLVDVPSGFRPFSFKPIRSRKSLIELFTDRGIRAGLHYLGLTGISEPFLYLKRFNELSKGQQYRVMLAQMLASDHNVWIADEFCSSLDDVTANLVAYNVQKIARRHHATVIVAASSTRNFVHSLRPDRVIRLTSSSHSAVMTGPEYIEKLRLRPHRTQHVARLDAESDVLVSARAGHHHAAICRGRKQFDENLFVLAKADSDSLYRITSSTRKRILDLTDEDASLDGFSSSRQLRQYLNTVDPLLSDTHFVTIVRFVPVCGEAHRDS